MTLAVWLRRLSHLPWLEGTLRAAAIRGVRVLGVLDRSAHHPLKPAPSFGALPPRVRGLAEWTTPTDPELARADVILSAGPSGDFTEASAPSAPGETVQTEWGAGKFLPPVTLTWDRIGYPLADTITWTDPGEVRRTHALSRPVLLVLPFPHASTRRSAWSLYWRYWGERALSRALRACADRHGWLLVVKSRPKTPVPGHLARVADRVIGADEPGEATTLRLLAHTAFLVHYYSTAAVEAVWRNVPALCIAPSASQWPAYAPHAQWSGFYDLFSLGRVLPPAQSIRWLAQAENVAPPMNAPSRSAYLSRLFGSPRLDSGRRILEAVTCARGSAGSDGRRGWDAR